MPFILCLAFFISCLHFLCRFACMVALPFAWFAFLFCPFSDSWLLPRVFIISRTLATIGFGKMPLSIIIFTLPFFSPCKQMAGHSELSSYSLLLGKRHVSTIVQFTSPLDFNTLPVDSWNFLALTAAMLCWVCRGTKTMGANFSDHRREMYGVYSLAGWLKTFHNSVTTPNILKLAELIEIAYRNPFWLDERWLWKNWRVYYRNVLSYIE